MLKCRICGAEYEGCKSAPLFTKGYRWQDVACCPEHGAEYLRQVMIARGELMEEKEDTASVKKNRKKKAEEPASEE